NMSNDSQAQLFLASIPLPLSYAIVAVPFQCSRWIFDKKSKEVFLTIRRDSDGNHQFTETDEISFIKISAVNPSLGTETIGEPMWEELKTLLLK
ncbi:MAG: hypothetical protein ACM37W_17480, partial [Actinomycetota bacterium]